MMAHPYGKAQDSGVSPFNPANHTEAKRTKPDGAGQWDYEGWVAPVISRAVRHGQSAEAAA